MEIYPVFHGSLLEPATKDLLPGQISLPPPLEEIDGEEEYTVQEVHNLQEYKRWKKPQYLV